MRIIRIELEYECFPIWIYGENGELIENDLPQYLIGDNDIEPLFSHIQEVYNSLYLDDGKDFRYIGFIENEKWENYFREITTAINLLKNKLSNEYIMEENIDYLRI